MLHILIGTQETGFDQNKHFFVCFAAGTDARRMEFRDHKNDAYQLEISTYLSAADATHTGPTSWIAVDNGNIIGLIGARLETNARSAMVFVECRLDHLHLMSVCRINTR